ncbi:MAG TPA: SDR family oxidoreductase [Alphaproteobacteria bacterium]|nr:SDR family oxidoreductase [Alphaproteobacteria bacterium]
MSGERRAAVVTGGASGIGLAIVRHLAGEGMSVVAADRDEAACAEARKALVQFGDRVRVVVADIGTPEGANAAVQTAVKEFGRIDLLVNNAAVHPIETIEEHSFETWRETFRVNVDGAMLCSRAALPHMKRQGRGVIVNMGSVSGEVPYATGGAYGASKAAIALMTKVLAVEAGPYGVRVNCISAGTIRHRAETYGTADQKPAHIPIGRAGSTGDVAQLVSYLASDAASYLTGAVITLDGGATAGRPKTTKRK